MQQIHTTTNKAVATVGMFDGVHRGHVFLLQNVAALARERGTESLAVTFNPHPMHIIAPEKEPPALCSLSRRVELIKQSGIDNVAVMEFNSNLRQLTAAQFIALLRNKYNVGTIILGYDHAFGSDRLSSIEQYRHAARQSNVEILRLENFATSAVAGNAPSSAISSSAIRKALSGGNVAEASGMLGRPYALSGAVIHGKALGRTIGFPTANISVPNNPVVPACGVYACLISLQNAGSSPQLLPAMVNIGKNPTVNTTAAGLPSIEAHIIDFCGDIYGHNVTLHFIDRLRGEIKFPSLQHLEKQLAADRQHTLSVLERHNLGKTTGKSIDYVRECVHGTCNPTQ